MKLLVFMYHRALPLIDGNKSAMLALHFKYIAEHCHCVLPGDYLRSDKINVCISFDDAYYDFYTHAFPLLKRYKLRALLAVCPALIVDSPKLSHYERLNIESDLAKQNPSLGGLCTWDELAQIRDSGLVQFASHGMNHVRLDLSTADLFNELVTSQIKLKSKLNVDVNSFVFPFGKFNPLSLSLAKKHYKYLFRIGSASNVTWDDGLIYRIPADHMSNPAYHFCRFNILRYSLKRFWNRSRFR